eukprot:3232482-Heterocapsa_arctica.AAC.1
MWKPSWSKWTQPLLAAKGAQQQAQAKAHAEIVQTRGAKPEGQLSAVASFDLAPGAASCSGDAAAAAFLARSRSAAASSSRD